MGFHLQMTLTPYLPMKIGECQKIDWFSPILDVFCISTRHKIWGLKTGRNHIFPVSNKSLVSCQDWDSKSGSLGWIFNRENEKVTTIIARVLPLGFALLPKMKPGTQKLVAKLDYFFLSGGSTFLPVLQIRYWRPSWKVFLSPSAELGRGEGERSSYYRIFKICPFAF